MLYLWMPDAGHWRWSMGEQWHTAASIDELKDAVAVHQPKHAIVFFSSLHVQHAHFSLQKNHYKQLGEQGIRYLIEDHVIEPLDQLRLCSVYEHGQLSMMAINQSRLEMMQQSLSLLPWRIEALLPDYLLLPEPLAEQGVLRTWGDSFIYRQQAYQGAVIDDLALFCEFLPEDQVVVIGEDDTILLEKLQQFLAPERIQQQRLGVALEEKLKRHPFNIWQTERKQSQFSPLWKACAAVLCLAIATQLLHDGVRWYRFKHVADQTAERMIEQYRQWFGQGYRVSEQNIQSDFEARVRLSQSADLTALSLLSRIGPVMTQQNVTAEQISYQDNRLSMNLKAANAVVLENMTKQLNQQGFQAQLGNIQTVGNQVLGAIKVQ